MKNTLPLHPFLIAIYPVLFLYSENIRQLSVSVVLVPLVFFGVSALILLLIGKRFLGNSERAALCVSIFFVWLFSYSVVRSTIAFEIAGMQLYRHMYFILIWTAVLLISLLLAVKVLLDYVKISKVLNIFAVLLILFPFLTITSDRYNQSTSPGSKAAPLRNGDISLSVRTDTLPDIYYIILDSYTGQKALKQYLDFDNSSFVHFLRSKGFFVAEDSHSNYAWTDLSVASTLNMDYLPTTPKSRASDTLQVDGTVSEYDLIRNSRARDFLESLGYKFVDLSIWSNQLFVTSNDYLYEYFTNDFNLSLLQMTILDRPLVENYILARVKRERILRTFDDLRSVVDAQGPVFVYAHFLIPHHPYVFDRTGNMHPFYLPRTENGSEKNRYLEQLLYANKEMEKTIDVILTKSTRIPIIVVQGDHGADQLGEGELVNARMRMSILNAYYLPDKGKKALYETITPVNTFRVIFNTYFGANLPLLPDEAFFSKNEPNPKLINITPLLRQ